MMASTPGTFTAGPIAASAYARTDNGVDRTGLNTLSAANTFIFANVGDFFDLGLSLGIERLWLDPH